MNLFLVHHGDAVGPEIDPQRPLSAVGRANVDRLATLAAARGARPSVVWHSGKLRARQTAEAAHMHFFLNVRTDVFFQTPPEEHTDAMVAEAIERARAYADVGADGLFAPGLVDITLIGRLAKESSLPLNVMVSDATPSVRMLAEHGVARVSHGPRPYLVAMKALETAARAASQ